MADAPHGRRPRTPRTRGLFTRRASRTRYRSSLTSNRSETARWLSTLHTTRASLPLRRPCRTAAPAYSPFSRRYPAPCRLPQFTAGQKTDLDHTTNDAVASLVNHATVDGENESPAITVRVIETRWRPTRLVIIPINPLGATTALPSYQNLRA